MVESAVQSHTEKVASSTEKSKIRVLHVDDELDLLKVAKLCLELQGPFEIDSVSSVEEALPKLQEEQYDAVVSDYQMPEKDGLEFLEMLRKNGNTIPFIMFTGKGREEVAVKAWNLGADHYVNKTGDPETLYCELAHCLRSTVEKHLAEAQMRETVQKLQTIYQNAVEGISYIDAKENIVYANKAFASIIGYEQDKLAGMNLHKIVDDENWAKIRSETERRRQGEASRYEAVFHRSDGTVRNALISGAPLLDNEGRFAGTIGIVLDITESKKAGKETESMAKFPAQNPEPVLRISSDGTLLYANQASQNMLRESQFKKNRTLETLHRHAADALSSNEHSLFEEEHDGRIFQFNVVPVASEGYANLYATDITERKQMEKQLKESEEKYRNLVENSQDAIAIVNFKGNVLFANQAAERLVGYTLKEGKGLNIRIVTPKRYWPKSVAMLLKARMGKPIPYFEYEIKRKDGTIIPVETGGQAIFENGKPVAIQIITREITERKKTQEALKDSEEKFRNLAEQSPNMIFINQKGKVVYANRKAEDVMGYTREEFCSPDFNFLDLIAEESKESVKSAFSKHKRGDDVAPYEYKLITKEGRTIDAIINSKLIKYDGEPAILGVVTDITDRKKAERMTLASQQNFKALFMGNPEAAAHLAPDFHILDVNPRFEELFGYSLAEAKGRHINDVIVPKTKMEEAETLDKNAAEGYVYHNTLRKRKDGSLVPVAVSAATIIVEGKLAGCIAMYKDISELKSAEKKLETMNEKLRVVGGLTRHDVRNKLSSITGNAYLLKKQLAGDSRVLEKLGSVETAVQQTVRILEFAKAYESLGVEELAYMDVKKAIGEAVALFPNLKGIEIINKCGGLTLLADSLLQQMFYNLIDNSLKYGQKTSRIKVHYEETGLDELRLFYEDDGVGIPETDKARLFREGYSTGGSTGYGLYLTKKMMEVYGWAIQEKGETGKGALFTITIPKVNQNGEENYHIV